MLILSGKGGVGKSTFTCQLARELHSRGRKVGILDVDLCGPSIPRMFNVDESSVMQCGEGWLPIEVQPGLVVMSIGFLLSSKDDAVVWRGPKKNAMIKQFLMDVCWNELDYLLIDTPPGTSDEHITTVETLRKHTSIKGAILVTTPQAVAVGDVLRELTFCRKLGVPITGIVENMSGYICPCCSECTNIFSKGGGSSLAELSKVPFLGEIPLDPKLMKYLCNGGNYNDFDKDNPLKLALIDVVSKIVQITS